MQYQTKYFPAKDKSIIELAENEEIISVQFTEKQGEPYWVCLVSIGNKENIEASDEETIIETKPQISKSTWSDLTKEEQLQYMHLDSFRKRAAKMNSKEPDELIPSELLPGIVRQEYSEEELNQLIPDNTELIREIIEFTQRITNLQ